MIFILKNTLPKTDFFHLSKSPLKKFFWAHNTAGVQSSALLWFFGRGMNEWIIIIIIMVIKLVGPRQKKVKTKKKLSFFFWWVRFLTSQSATDQSKFTLFNQIFWAPQQIQKIFGKIVGTFCARQKIASGKQLDKFWHPKVFQILQNP